MAKKTWLMMQVKILAVTAIALLLIFEVSHLDIFISNYFFNAQLKTFELREHPFLTQVMHHGLKSFMYVLGVASIVIGVFLLKKCRGLIQAKHIAVGSLGVILIPALVALLKHLTNKHCPWSLDIYGGQVPYAGLFESHASNLGAGQCFPAGHAAGGFMWFAWSVALMSTYPRLAKILFYFAIVMGLALGLARMMQGAHFLSHVLWTAWFAWLISLILAITFRVISVTDKSRHILCIKS
jgi:membrane-associated PAP2 superfamily phosphatase